MMFTSPSWAPEESWAASIIATLELLVKTCVGKAVQVCPSLSNRNIAPHFLRHTAAMFMMDSGVDIVVIALYLGHADVKTTYRYLHHNRRIKEKAMGQTNFPAPSALMSDNDESPEVETKSLQGD